MKKSINDFNNSLGKLENILNDSIFGPKLEIAVEKLDEVGKKYAEVVSRLEQRGVELEKAKTMAIDILLGELTGFEKSILEFVFFLFLPVFATKNPMRQTNRDLL